MEKVKEDKDARVIEEINTILKNYESKKISIKVDDYVPFVDSILEKWAHKSKDKNFHEHLIVSTLKILEAGIKEKELNTFHEKISNENKIFLVRALYAASERIANKKDCFSIRSTKIFHLYQKLSGFLGEGGVARSLFSIQK